MNNKPLAKKATVATVVFCILLVLGILLNLTVGACNRSEKRRSVVITFSGVLDASKLQSELETKLEGSVVLNEKDKAATTATTTTTKAPTTAATTAASTTVAATTEGAAAAAETTQATTTTATTAPSTGTGSTTTADGGSTTTTTKAAATTTPANGFKSGKLVATVGNCDEKSDDDLRRIFAEIFAGESFAGNDLSIVEIYEVKPIAGFSVTQLYTCIVLLIIVFVYCLIRFSTIGAVASAVSVVVPAIASIIGSLGVALIFRVFADIDISAIAAVATVATVVFANIVLEATKSGSKNADSTIISMTTVVSALLVLVAIVSLIAWNGEIIFSCLQYASAAIVSAISALVYVRYIMGMLAPKAFDNKKKASKKPVIK